MKEQYIKEGVKEGVFDFHWLKYPYQYVNVSCTNEQVENVKEFAEAVYEKRKKVYKKRGQADKDTIVNQITTSKCFEFMVYNYIKDIIPSNLSVEPPSLEIYGRYTTFDNDLDITDGDSSVGIHIKSQDIKRIDSSFPISWGFQKIDPIFQQKQNDILIMGIYKDKNNGMILSNNHVNAFKDLLKPPMISRLADKVFLYYDVNLPAYQLET